eukprot:2105879-Pleurochrysis_carterae.AAC.3
MRNEVELSGWGSTFRIGRTGNQYIAGFNALGLAACCAAVAKLPANHFAPQLPFPRCGAPAGTEPALACSC